MKDLYMYSNDFPIDFEKFTEFIYLCQQPKQASSIVSAFTDDVPKLLNLLERSHARIQDSSMKNRITRISNSLKASTET